jgi:hypothetical protein
MQLDAIIEFQQHRLSFWLDDSAGQIRTSKTLDSMDRVPERHHRQIAASIAARCAQEIQRSKSTKVLERRNETRTNVVHIHRRTFVRRDRMPFSNDHQAISMPVVRSLTPKPARVPVGFGTDARPGVPWPIASRLDGRVPSILAGCRGR